jgi:hypothetical protein
VLVGDHATAEPVKRPQARWWRPLCLVVVTLALWLAFVEVPLAPEPGLDPSWQLVLVHAHRADLQFGPEVAFTYGPLGFLTSRFSYDGIPPARSVWEVAGKLALAATFVVFGRGLSPGRRALLIVALLFVTLQSFENVLTACVTLTIVLWLLPRGARPWQLAGALAWLVLLSHVKFTFLAQALAGVGLAAVAMAMRGERRRAVAVVSAFTATYVIAWVLAGQAPLNLPTYLRHGWEISAGYGGAMSASTAPKSTWWTAGAIFTLVALALGTALRRPAERPVTWAPVVYLAVAWLLVWKHAFTRADGHVLGFFNITLLLSLAVRPLLEARRWSWLDACPALCLVGFGMFDLTPLAHFPRALADRWTSSSAEVLRPGLASAEKAERTRSVRATEARPELQAMIGRGTVDVIGHDQVQVLLNDLAYRPRPIFQSYSAYTSALLRHNLRFYQSDRAPEFVLARLQTIDGRLPAQDDSLVLAELRRRYDVEACTSDVALLRRKSRQPASVDQPRELLPEVTVKMGEAVTLPAARDGALWLRAEFVPTFRGRWRSFAGQPVRLRIVLTTDADEELSFRVIPGIAAEGFIIQPLLGEQHDLNALLRGRGARWLRSFRFEPASAARHWSEVRIQLSRLPELSLVPSTPYAELVEEGFIDVAPEAIRCDARVERLLEDGRPALQVHAPGELVVRPPPGARRLTGWYGLRRAVTTGGQVGDGVEFVVTLLHDDGRREELWRSWLDPFRREGDRGPQALDLELPAGDYRVVLETGAGPAGDLGMDWSYWSALRLSR